VYVPVLYAQSMEVNDQLSDLAFPPANREEIFESDSSGNASILNRVGEGL